MAMGASLADREKHGNSCSPPVRTRILLPPAKKVLMWVGLSSPAGLESRTGMSDLLSCRGNNIKKPPWIPRHPAEKRGGEIHESPS